MAIGNSAMKITFGDDLTGSGASGINITMPEGFTSLYLIKRSGTGNVTITCNAPSGDQEFTIRDNGEFLRWGSDGQGGVYKSVVINVPNGVTITYAYNV